MEHWLDPAGNAIPIEHLRTVVSESETEAQFNPQEPTRFNLIAKLKGAQHRRVKSILNEEELNEEERAPQRSLATISESVDRQRRMVGRVTFAYNIGSNFKTFCLPDWVWDSPEFPPA